MVIDKDMLENVWGRMFADNIRVNMVKFEILPTVGVTDKELDLINIHTLAGATKQNTMFSIMSTIINGNNSNQFNAPA